MPSPAPTNQSPAGITVTLSPERFEAVQWAVHIAIQMRNARYQEALLEASNDLGLAALSGTEEEGRTQTGCERCEHIAAEALAMAEELEGQPLKRNFRSVEEIKREFFPALFAEEQKVAREGEPPPELSSRTDLPEGEGE